MKIKIALRNLYISQAVILAFLIFAYFLWFPHSFSDLGGFYKTAWMLIFVDLVLGPLLVLFIYKENKKHLVFDINVLLTIQLTAFLFGAYSLYLKHPAYVVFSVDRFVLTNVSNLYPIPSWSDQIKNHFFSSPQFVVANLPTDSIERHNLTLEVMLLGKPDIDSRPKYFSPFTRDTDIVMSKSINIEQLDLDVQAKEKMSLFTKEHEGKIDEFAFFPLRGNNKKDMVWVFNKKTAKPVDIIDIDPWKYKIASNISKK